MMGLLGCGTSANSAASGDIVLDSDGAAPIGRATGVKVGILLFSSVLPMAREPLSIGDAGLFLVAITLLSSSTDDDFGLGVGSGK